MPTLPATPALLITDCLQNDFVGSVSRFEGLPNALHVGYDESARLLGSTPSEGPVSRMIAWANQQGDERLKLIHIRDWHDPGDPKQREHLEQFGCHCIKDTPGAEFVFPTEGLHPDKRLAIVNATTLSNFVDADLDQVLEAYRGQALRVGLMGVWTEAKITFLAYDLRTRYPEFRLAVCSALTASSSRENHFIALDQIERILGIEVIPSVGEFIEYLGGRANDAPLIGFSQKHPVVSLSDSRPLCDTDLQLLRYLFRGCRTLDVRTLDGGFSGNVVLGTRSVDLHGHEQVAHVVKIGPKGPIGKERTAFERIEAVLGNSAPRIADYADLGARGAIKYRYATMGGGESRSFQKLYESGASDAKVRKMLDAVFVEQLGRFYRAAELEKCELLDYYEFKPQWADSVRERVREVLGKQSDAAYLEFPDGERLPNIAGFYETTLASLPRLPRSHYFSYIHGDLNGANIIIDGQANVWLIDFFHAHRGHVLKDLIKLENDLLYIYTKIGNEDELIQAMRLTALLVGIEDLGRPLPELPAHNAQGITNPLIQRAYRHIRILRSYYPALLRADRESTQWLIGHLRYAVHTLGFDEANVWQKRWALYTACLAAQSLTRHLFNNGPLRIDWLPAETTQPGRLGMTIAPGRRDFGRSLDEDLKVIRKEGVDAVVCLLAVDEFQKYGLDDLFDRYHAVQLDVYQLPILDGRVPSRDELNALVAWLEQTLASGKRVLMHCAGGLGRAGTVAACFLRQRGLSAEQAIATVRQARSLRAIETAVQEEAIRAFGR